MNKVMVSWFAVFAVGVGLPSLMLWLAPGFGSAGGADEVLLAMFFSFFMLGLFMLLGARFKFLDLGSSDRLPIPMISAIMAVLVGLGTYLAVFLQF